MRTIIYQALVRLFGNVKEANQVSGSRSINGVGKFADFTSQALREIRSLGATHIWYTGVLRHAHPDHDPLPLVKGEAGSPYAITDYYDLDDDLAIDPLRRHEEFTALINRTREAGLKSLIDFVPNHVARTYQGDLGSWDDNTKSFSPQNNFYPLPGETLVLPRGNQGYEEEPPRASGNDVFHGNPKEEDWYDTVKINYGVDYQNGGEKHFFPLPRTWSMMLKILMFWAKKGVDGFRCDMAEMVPPEFWGWAIPQVRAEYPGILFIAEIYQVQAYATYLNQGKFDLLYDKCGLYDAVRNVIEGKTLAETLPQAFEIARPFQERLLNFVENHDEQRVSSPFFAGSPERGLAAFTLITCLGRGAVMIYFGQEVGEPGDGVKGYTGNDGRTTIYDYWGVVEHQKWMNQGAFDGGKLSGEQRWLRQSYRNLLQRLARDEILLYGSTTFLSGTSGTKVEWLREYHGVSHHFFVDLASGVVKATYGVSPFVHEGVLIENLSDPE